LEKPTSTFIKHQASKSYSFVISSTQKFKET